MRRHAKYFTRKEAMELIWTAYLAGAMQGEKNGADIYWHGRCLDGKDTFKAWFDKIRPLGDTPL